jgi:UDP-N-acetylmuramyl pentapeptide phosphotransferase/UDP-N-acetylglucosamine-1-phosphate transferase
MLVAIFAMALSLFWCITGVFIYPWIVPADGIGGQRTNEKAYPVAIGLAFVSVVSIFLALGMFRGRWARWAVAFVLIACHMLAAGYLDFYSELSQDAARRFMAGHLFSIAVVVTGAACGPSESASAVRIGESPRAEPRA